MNGNFQDTNITFWDFFVVVIFVILSFGFFDWQKNSLWKILLIIKTRFSDQFYNANASQSEEYSEIQANFVSFYALKQ